MLTNTLVIFAEDGTKMQSLHYKTVQHVRKIVIHVHGMAGNFYENTFIEKIAEKCNKNGVDFLVFNNRGHDYIADCERVIEGRTESFSAGGAYEKFDECIFDIKGAVQWAVAEGYSEIILEGHSSGANKLIYSFEKLNSESLLNKYIKGFVLISPCDDIGIYNSEIEENERKKSFNLANSYIHDGENDKLMPKGTFFDYVLSAETFLNCFTEGSPLDMFPYRKGTLQNTRLSKIKLPMLIIFGNNGDFVLQEFDEIADMYKKSGIQDFEMKVIDQAGHSYRGCEEELSSSIIDWIGLH